uniref:Uncharacterized protein n=1 Tax=Aegilops tauschii subsp. strangulata TaxID=200361 RepID=A0A453Q3H8_AEGTS
KIRSWPPPSPRADRGVESVPSSRLARLAFSDLWWVPPFLVRRCGRLGNEIGPRSRPYLLCRFLSLSFCWIIVEAA